MAITPPVTLAPFVGTAVPAPNGVAPFEIITAGPPRDPTALQTAGQAEQTSADFYIALSAKITTSNPLPSEPAPPAPTDNFIVADLTSQQSFSTPGSAFTGTGIPGALQFVDISLDALEIKATAPNAFIKSGDGNDVLAVTSGTNVLDSSAGNDTMFGGTGDDTFLATVLAQSSAKIIENFHGGDLAIIRGISLKDFGLNFVDTLGTSSLGNATGDLSVKLTNLSGNGQIATLRLPGFTTGDVASGRLLVGFGTDPGTGTPYMAVQALS